MTVYLHITRNLTGIAIFCWNVNKRFFSVLNYDKIDSNAEVTLDLLDNTEVASSPNFVVEVHSNSDSEDYCHQRMLDYMDADVEDILN
ncbi:1105_t:CDS:2 [Rhizophagus irregularis]|nr:1105_t:CDS:2 [Rhizophagus irregularis]